MHIPACPHVAESHVPQQLQRGPCCNVRSTFHIHKESVRSGGNHGSKPCFLHLSRNYKLCCHALFFALLQQNGQIFISGNASCKPYMAHPILPAVPDQVQRFSHRKNFLPVRKFYIQAQGAVVCVKIMVVDVGRLFQVGLCLRDAPIFIIQLKIGNQGLDEGVPIGPDPYPAPQCFPFGRQAQPGFLQTRYEFIHQQRMTPVGAHLYANLGQHSRFSKIDIDSYVFCFFPGFQRFPQGFRTALPTDSLQSVKDGFPYGKDNNQTHDIQFAPAGHGANLFNRSAFWQGCCHPIQGSP